MRDEPKKSPLLRWSLPALRYGLCAVAILYLYYNVTWYDSVTLAGSKAPASQAPFHGGWQPAGVFFDASGPR